MNTEIKTFYDCMTSVDGGTMRSWPERMHITDQVLHPSYMYMLEVVFAEVWAERKSAIVELLGRNFDPEHIGPLVAETLERMENQGIFAGRVGCHAKVLAWKKTQESLPNLLTQTATEEQKRLEEVAKRNVALNLMAINASKLGFSY